MNLFEYCPKSDWSLNGPSNLIYLAWPNYIIRQLTKPWLTVAFGAEQRQTCAAGRDVIDRTA